MVVDLSNKLIDLGYRTSICCLAYRGAFAEKVHSEVEVVDIGKQDLLDLSAVVNLRSYLLKRKVDILHVHNPGALLYGVLAAKWAHTPVIVCTEHGFSYQLSLKTRLKDKLLYTLVDSVIAVSESLRQELISVYGFRNAKLCTVKNGISSGQMDGHRSGTRKQIGIRDDCFNIGIVARLVPVKNHRMLFKAFSIVKHQNPSARLWVVGSGQLRSELENLARALEVRDQVIFTGDRMDVPRILNALDLFVLTSFSEGLSITLLEAMSVGLPIIATNVGGNSEVIEQEESGLLVESNQPTDLANAILRIMGSTGLAQRLGLNAQQRFLKNFTIEHMVKKLYEVYCTLVEKKIGK